MEEDLVKHRFNKIEEETYPVGIISRRVVCSFVYMWHKNFIPKGCTDYMQLDHNTFMIMFLVQIFLYIINMKSMKSMILLHNTIIREYEKRLKDPTQIIKEIELELGNVTDAKVIPELQVATGDEQVKINPIEEKLNFKRLRPNDSSFPVKVK